MGNHRAIPFGYEIKNCVIAINPIEADAVRMLFDLYISGIGYKPIAAKMTALGAAYHQDAGWNQHMVKRILENRRYTGVDGYPAIITSDVFSGVAARKATNPYCKTPQREVNKDDEIDTATPVYVPTQAVRRMSNEIDRALEKNTGDADAIRSLILACAAEKYITLRGVALHG